MNKQQTPGDLMSLQKKKNQKTVKTLINSAALSTNPQIQQRYVHNLEIKITVF